MDEEKEQTNEQTQDVRSALNKGVKKQKEQGMKKVFKKIVLVIAAKLLIGFCIAFGIYLFITSIVQYLDKEDSKEAKEASSSAIAYSASKARVNKIVVNTDNVTEDGAYELVFKFKDEEGKVCTEEEAIKIIKRNLLKENDKIDLKAFTDSELKVIGSLMNNGLETGKYSEEELKAFVVFIKADIAGNSYSITNGDKPNVKIEDLEDNDEVYGTIEVHKTTPTADGYQEVRLEYVSYSEFKKLISSSSSVALNKFSVDRKGNIIIARASSSSIKHKYQGSNGAELSSSDMGKIDQGNVEEDKEVFKVTEYTIPVNSEQYLSKYIASYGFLSDLLVTTRNVDFCLEIAELALNSKIVLNIREEPTVTKTYEETVYTQTTLEYDYVSYNVTGYDVTENWQVLTSGTGSPQVGTYGWNGSSKSWSRDGEDYRLNYKANTKRWTISKKIVNKTEANTPKEVVTQKLIVGGHISESYGDYGINEDYTSKSEFSYTKITETSSTNYKYDIDISEIDCWYLTYKRPYAPPKVISAALQPPEDVEGEFPTESAVAQEATNSSSIIGSNASVNNFKENKEKEYLRKYPSAEEAKCEVTSLTVKTKSKTSSKVEKYEGTRTSYKFGDESEADTTQVQFKNMEYVNNNPSYTSEGPKGFLFVYDRYISGGIDLCLKNDAEKKLFEMLEENEKTVNISDVMRFLLYIYDGIDRGVTDLDKTFKIIDISLINKSGMGASAFGCNMTREEFIDAAESYGESILSGLAGDFYDICTSSAYNVNPCLAYAWAALESGWGKSAVDDKNLFQMGTYTDQTSGFRYATFEDAIEDFCKWVVNSANPSSNAYSANYARAQEYATVNKKFNGKPDDSIYVLFSRYSFVGYTHTPNARACIRNTYTFLNDGIYECNHADSDPTTLQEQADYAQYTIEIRIKIAKDVFGKNCLLSGFGEFPEYQQSDPPWGTLTYGGPRGSASYPGNNGQRKTVGTSGCGCCALANILSGYTGEAITPDVLLDVLNDEYPGGNYYAPGQGSYAGALCGILYRYECAFLATRSRNEALKALEEGYAVLGGETGHFLAFVPVTSEEAEQGYIFRILDSARGHGGLYRSFEEADKVVKGSCVVTHIIYPPE